MITPRSRIQHLEPLSCHQTTPGVLPSDGYYGVIEGVWMHRREEVSKDAGLEGVVLHGQYEIKGI